MDHYRVMGVRQTASKEEIKEAFRKLALQYHPDKHTHSPKSVRDGATVRFKQLSEAYDILIDDRKRADYNLRYTNSQTSTGFRSGPRRPDAYSSSYSTAHASRYGSARAASGQGFFSNLDIGLRYLTTRGFLRNLLFCSTLLGGALVIETSGDTLWKMNNSGKSFEEAMESMEKVKTVKDKM